MNIIKGIQMDTFAGNIFVSLTISQTKHQRHILSGWIKTIYSSL